MLIYQRGHQRIEPRPAISDLGLRSPGRIRAGSEIAGHDKTWGEDGYNTHHWYSYGHLLVITGYKWDYTFYKWSYKYL